MSDRLLKESDVIKIAFQLPLVVNSAFADAVKALPSADRPQGWIPCSDRLPKDEGIFLVTMETYVFNEYSHPVGTSFYSPSFGWVNASPNKVLAWMPLPKPWKGVDDE